MRRRIKTFLDLACRALVCVGLASPLAAWCQFTGENLLENLPGGYKVGFRVKKGNMDMTEMVPESETVDSWTELLTTQVFHGLTNATLESFQLSMQRGAQTSCSNGTFTPVARNSENGYPFMVALMVCPMSHKTGKPELTWIKAIKGNDSFYVVQKAFRFDPSKEQVTQWMQYLRSVTVCDTRFENHPCPPLQAVGPLRTPGISAEH